MCVWAGTMSRRRLPACMAAKAVTRSDRNSAITFTCVCVCVCVRACACVCARVR